MNNAFQLSTDFGLSILIVLIDDIQYRYRIIHRYGFLVLNPSFEKKIHKTAIKKSIF